MMTFQDKYERLQKIAKDIQDPDLSLTDVHALKVAADRLSAECENEIMEMLRDDDESDA